ncbi:protein cup [Eupeodes corollae]|uniref:protein cup n=1 Tax=Eupeodes corollae TaxID=290404 RepID=UPI002493125B|nr:protein cup [Eupeodes corollae]
MSTNETQMEAKPESEQPQPETVVEMKETIVESETTSSIPTTEKLDEKEKLNKSSGLEVAIMLPPPPVLVNLAAAAAATAPSSATLVQANSRPPSSSSMTATTIATDKVDEEEVLSLQVLSARSSTPYTVQGICCANANCGLEATTDSSNASQWKEHEEEPTQLVVSEVIKESEEVIDQNDGIDDGDEKKKHKHLNGGRHSDYEGKKYSRSDLLEIRDEMTIIRHECLENARLHHLLKNMKDMKRNKSFRNSNPPNDLMPAFFKRKTASLNGSDTNSSSNSIIYDNFKYSDSNPFNHHHTDSGSSAGNGNNYRRIGSGRISSNREVNWDYIPEEDPEKNNLPEFFNTKDLIGSGSIQPKPQRPQKKHELDDNSNYVKRVISSATGGESSFRSIGSRHSINSSGEERYSSNASSSTNNRSDEPEWFSCGPTSRLDTIELCGFNESDQQKIRLEMSSKNKMDSNNNRSDFTPTGHNHNHNNNKEKKHLAFQFDDFSSSHNNKSSHHGSGANNTANKLPSSKFMPLFNAKKKDEETNTTHHSSTQSLNEFFKRNDMPLSTAAPLAAGGQKEKLSTTEMPSVDEIEAKWRSHQSNDSRGKPNSENFNNSSESFKKILHQLNQQQQQHVSSAGSISSPPIQPQANNNQQHHPLNLFNNDNLSNFIKHRNLQQQLLQKQQQQAAFAQLQFNAILSRPDTQMLLLSLARGEISKHGLVIQLSNPNLTQTDREAISAVLTFSAAGQYHQQLAINSNQQQQQQFIANQLQNLALMQQLNKSPASRRNANNAGGGTGGGTGSGSGGYQGNNNTTGVGGNNNNQRTYTQEELQSHANFILHNAMLKKKLEEQNIGLQKMLHLQTSMMNGNMNNNNNNNNNNHPRGGGNVVGGNDSMAGTKNFHYQQQKQQQNHQQQQRHRKFTNSSNRNNNHSMGRRRSTSSSSSNTANSGNLASQLQQTVNTQLRRQLEQRRNTIATATVRGGDDYNQISQRI